MFADLKMEAFAKKKGKSYNQRWSYRRSFNKRSKNRPINQQLQ